MDVEVQRNFNTAARALLEAMLSERARSYPVVRLAIKATVSSFPAAPDDSPQLLRRMLSEDEVREHGFEQLRDLAELVPELLTHDVALVCDIYRATFSWRDTSDEATPLRRGVLALNSNRRQEYDAARRQLAEHFGDLARCSVAGAADVLVEAVGSYLRGREIEPGQRRTLSVGGRHIEVFDDTSAYWDRAERPRDAEVEMLWTWQHALTEQADDERAIDEVLDAMARMPLVPASLLSHLLVAGADAPKTLGARLGDCLVQSSALAASETLVAYGDLLVALWPDLGEAQRERIERAIVALPESFGPDVAEVGAHRRDRLIGLLDPSCLVTQEARELSGRLRAGGHSGGNAPLIGPIEVGFRAVGDEESLRMRGVDPDLLDNRRALELSRAVRRWHDARVQADVETPPVEDLVEALTALIAALPELRDSSELSSELLAEAEGHLAQGGLDLAEHVTAQSPPEQLDLVLEIARASAAHSLPDAAKEDPDRWDSDQPFWGWPSPRVEAASIYLVLSHYPELASAEVLDGLSAAAADPSAAVRIKIAEYGWWAMRADVDRVWGWATNTARDEPRAAVLDAQLVTISNLYRADADRAVALATTIRQRELVGRRSRHLLVALAGLLAEWWIYDQRPEGRALVDEVLGDVPAHIDEATEVTHRLRRAVGFEGADGQRADEIRARAFSFFTELVRVACDHFDVLIAQDHPDAERLRQVSSLLDALAAELYFSSGAYERDDADGESVPIAARFYAEAGALLDEIVRIGIPHAADYLVRTLTHFVDVDPRGVLRRLRIVLGNGERWGLSADSLTENHLMPTVSHLLAAHRDLLMSDAQARADLVGALSTFSRAGSPSARRILYGLDDMFR